MFSCFAQNDFSALHVYTFIYIHTVCDSLIDLFYTCLPVYLF